MKRGTLKKKGPLSRHLTMHCNHLVYDSSIWGGGGGGGGHLLAIMYTRH